MLILRHLMLPVIAGWVASSCCSFACCQSTVITFANDQTSGTALHTELIPTNIPRAVREIEEKLNQTVPSTLLGQVSVRNLLERLEELGITCLVGESARENNLDEETVINFGIRGQSLASNLKYTLDYYQADFQIDPAGIVVIRSVDSMLDNLTEVTYDVSSLTVSPEEIVDNLMEVIDPDGWEENGGSARGIAYYTNGRRLISVTNTYSNQRRIRRHLDDVARMSGSSIGVAQLGGTSSLMGGSTVVLLPSEQALFNRRSRDADGGFGGGFGGRGGGGLGGGVF